MEKELVEALKAIHFEIQEFFRDGILDLAHVERARSIAAEALNRGGEEGDDWIDPQGSGWRGD